MGIKKKSLIIIFFLLFSSNVIGKQVFMDNFISLSWHNTRDILMTTSKMSQESGSPYITRIWNLNSNMTLSVNKTWENSLQKSGIGVNIWIDNNNQIASSNDNGSIMIWSPYESEDMIIPSKIINLNITQVKSMSWKKNILSVLSIDSQLYLLNGSDSYKQIRHYNDINEFSLNEESSSLALLNSDNSISIINLQNEDTIMKLKFNNTVSNIRWRSNHSEVYIIQNETEIGFISVSNNNYSPLFIENSNITDFDFSYNSNLLAYSLIGRSIRVYSLIEDKIITSLNLDAFDDSDYYGEQSIYVSWKNNNLIAFIDTIFLILWDINLNSIVTTQLIQEDTVDEFSALDDFIKLFYAILVVTIIYLIYRKFGRKRKNR